MLYISQIIDHYLIRFAFCGKTSLLLWQWSSRLVYFLAGRSFGKPKHSSHSWVHRSGTVWEGGTFFTNSVTSNIYVRMMTISLASQLYCSIFRTSWIKWKVELFEGGGPFPKILNLKSVTSYINDDDNLVSLTIIQFLGPDWSNWRAIQQFSNLKTDKRQVKRVFMRVGMNICPEAKRSPHLLA